MARLLAADGAQLPALRDVLSGAAPLALEAAPAPLALEAAAPLALEAPAPLAPLSPKDRKRKREEEEEEEEDACPRRVVHEALGQHTWSERPNRKAQCSLCENWDPFECECGIRLCDQCRRPPADWGVAPRYDWRQHPTEPMPFFVLDYAKWPDSEKLTWIRQEIGNNAELVEFTEKWIELFGDKIGGITIQRAACLKLYKAYAPPEMAREYDAENSLPPELLQGFQRLFAHEAPERCHGCNKASPRGYTHPIRAWGKPYCSKDCKQNDNQIVCRTCKSPACWWDTPSPGCENRRPHFEPGPGFSCWPPWTLWIHGFAKSLDYNPYWPWAQHPLGSEGQRLEEKRLMDRWFQAHFFEARPREDRKPAWKQRRRS